MKSLIEKLLILQHDFCTLSDYKFACRVNELLPEIMATLEAQAEEITRIKSRGMIPTEVLIDEFDTLSLRVRINTLEEKLARQERLLKKAATLIKISDYCRTDYDKKIKWLAALSKESDEK